MRQEKTGEKFSTFEKIYIGGIIVILGIGVAVCLCVLALSWANW